jgi:hypothetical protein
MKTRPLARIFHALLAGITAPAVLLAAFAVGGVAYTKRPETKLLSEPKPLAEATARVPYARPLKILEVRGAWLRVSADKAAGWVFAGNLAEEKPSETRGLDGLPIAASETTATAAARPLVPASEEYSSRHGLASAADDLTWLTQQQAAITPEAVQAYLQAQKKGEFK